MFTSTTTSEYSILERPQIIKKPLAMDVTTTTTKWKNYCNNSIELAPNCPRCASSNTKFCYYNNYSLSQPRYFCKACRRYWTKGGSLRNVPVGGGCRKSRRARAARQGGAANYAVPAISAGFVGLTNDSEGGTDIDLAAVYAKFVSQNMDKEESCSPGASSGSSSDNVPASSLEIDSQLEDITMFEYQKSTDLINRADDHQILQVLPDQFYVHDEINGQEFVYQDCNAFEMQQSILGDELAGDIQWSEGTNLPNFGSHESMVEVQDLGLFSPDDQLRISANNIVTDNWSSYDLSAYEFFSRS